MMRTKIVVWTWLEPQEGCDAAAFNLPERHWPAVDRAIAALAAAAGHEWGRTIAAAKIIDRPTCVAAPARVHHVLAALASASRYDTGEELYRRDLPEFAAAGVARS